VSPRQPSPALTVDSNVLLSVAFGLRSRRVFDVVKNERSVLASAGTRDEALRRARLANGVADAVSVVELLLAAIDVIEEEIYADYLDAAATVLLLAPASRNGSTRDAHVLAVAWAFDADIWSHDRDFAGTGWPSWSNANLTAALRPQPAG
jgi:predicted nucleic acid-binding protein